MNWRFLNKKPPVQSHAAPTPRLADESASLRQPLDSGDRLFQTLLDALPDLVWLTGLDGVFLRCNRLFEHMLGEQERNIIGKSPDDFFSREQADCLAGQDLSVINTSQANTGSTLLAFTRTGLPRLFQITKTPVFDPTGKLYAILSVAHDITRSNYNEAFLNNANRILEQITRDAPLTATFKEIVHSIEAANPQMYCAIMVLDADQQHLHHGYAARLPEAYCQAIDGVAIGPTVGSCGTAAYTGTAVFVDDIASDPLWRDYVQLAADYGLKACWSTPILSSQNQVIGTFAVYYREAPCTASARDRQIVKHYTNLASIAIERWQAQETLKTNVAKFQRLIEHAPLPLAYVGYDGDINFINQRFIQSYGYTPDDVPHLEEWWPVAYPDADYRRQVIATWNTELAKAIADNATDIAPREYAVTCKNGDVRISEIFGILFEDGFLVTFIDLTTYKNSEKAVKDSELRLRSILGNANAGIAVTDAQGNFQEFNTSFADLLNIPADELKGMNCLEFTHPDDYALVQRHFQDIHANLSDNCRMERRFVTRSGHCLWVDLSINVIRDEHNQVQNLVALAVDIDERKQTEHQLHSQMDELRRWHRAMLGRESRVLEMKREVNELLAQQGQPPRYANSGDG